MDEFKRDVLLQCSRSISAAIGPLDNGLFVLTLDSRNNASSEIIPTWNLRNALHDTCAKNSSKLNCIVSACCFSWAPQNPMRMRYALPQSRSDTPLRKVGMKTRRTQQSQGCNWMQLPNWPFPNSILKLRPRLISHQCASDKGVKNLNRCFQS